MTVSARLPSAPCLYMPSLAFTFSVLWPHSDQGTTLHLFQAGWKSACSVGVVRGVYVYETVDSQTVPKWDSPTQYRSTLCPHQSNLVQSGWSIPGRVCEWVGGLGWSGWGSRGVPLPPSLLLCADAHWTLTNIHTCSTHRQKGHCALNTDTSSLTSESFSKCHLGPEWQCQQWQLSSKEHLRLAAAVSLSKLILSVSDTPSLDCNFLYESLNFENWEHVSIPVREKPKLTFG